MAEVLVTLSLNGEDLRVGKLWFAIRGKRESAAFAYDEKWLEHPERFALAPALGLTAGTFYTTPGIRVFGAMGDSAPDRWGRMLMRRAELLRAKTQHTSPLTLLEIDYLLGVDDEARQGALRFSLPSAERVFLASARPQRIPPLVELPRLLAATEAFIAEDESAADLKLLLTPGSSLGGARPKASVRDKDGSLVIAKFPKQDDEFKVVLWEAVALTLAAKAGIHVPPYRVEKILQKPVLLVKRFDRQGNKRIPFISALSMLSALDNEQHSYLEIAYAILQNGAAPLEDLEELWRRMVFNIMIANVDDHLRNHGFLYERYKGWRLSPVYDLNPTPLEISPRILTTAINLVEHSASLDLAMSVVQDFRLKPDIAWKIIQEISEVVKKWRAVATAYGLSKRECERMASAFMYK